MIIQQILTPGRTRLGVPAASKKKILELVAECISNDIPTINSADLFDALITRERLGTTGLGNGIALPHCRFKNCPEPTGLFLRMEHPVDYDAIDRKSVDLVFALIVPDGDNQEHLQILQALAERFYSEELVQELRQANSSSELFNILVNDKEPV
ncbi:PTS IIA-like nitrogen-regulatory protein PtsN [Endozoicomonas sp. (ex Bugula neritina AB1)]|nr:PTS IIA-like nitrogen-regulatory protein PtsN [Endozoicomonas sp. (ex Bugula neritina AB1)]